MIKTLIVDDEPLALDILQNYIDKIPDVELVGQCTNAIDASSFIQANDVDLVLLDIQMPQMTGVELVKSLNKVPKIIFTTAFPEYAVEGFDLNVVDYLLKPFAFDRFLKAINKVKDSIQDRTIDIQPGEDYVFIKADKKLVKVYFNEVLYIEGLKDYVIIKKNDSRIIALQTMKSLEQKLPQQIFKRIHRSYIINITKIRAVVGNSVEILEKGQIKHLPIGKNYKDDLLKVVEEKKL